MKRKAISLMLCACLTLSAIAGIAFGGGRSAVRPACDLPYEEMSF